jgi:hypothetical protein
MRCEKSKLSVVLLLGLGLTGLQAQTSVNATGSNASGSGGTANYSVGQVVFTTNTGTNGSVAQGVQQPYEISGVTGIKDAKGITLQCSAYPNPATDFLTLKIEGEVKTQYTASLYDNAGKLLDSKKIENIETIFSMKNIVSATYFLKVSQGEKEIKIFKIIKK